MFGRKHLLSLTSLAIVAFLMFAAFAGNSANNSSRVEASADDRDLQLNLSHIECVDNAVEIHFVLLNVPDGITPGTLTYTYGSITAGPHTGNVWHYTASGLPDGHYDVAFAEVMVDGVLVTLHNPHDYANDYNCAPPPVDLCPNLDGVQETVPDGMEVDENGNCVVPPPPPVDVCPNIEGVQETIPDGLVIDDSGDCITPPPQVNTASIQIVADCQGFVVVVNANAPFSIEGANFFSWAENPTGFYNFTVVFDNGGEPAQIQFTAGVGDNPFAQLPEECIPPVDVCPNLEGDQATIPDGMEVDENGNCVVPPPPPTDMCPNIEGDQDGVPEGMVLDEAGNCVIPPPPPPPPNNDALCAWVGFESYVGHTYSLVDYNTPQVYVNYPAIEAKGELWVILDASLYSGNRYRLILDDGTVLLSFQLVGLGGGNDLHQNCLTEVQDPPTAQEAPPPAPTCANCGPAVREIIPDGGVAITYHAEAIGCAVDLCNPDNLIFYVDYEGLVPFSVSIDGEVVAAEEVTNAFGTFYRMYDVSADAELVLLDENGEPFAGPTETYTACSIWPTGARVNADNSMTHYSGATEWDITEWLVELGVDRTEAQTWAHELAMQYGGSLPLPEAALE